VIIVSEEISVSGSKSLEVNKVRAFVSAFDSFDLHTPSHLDEIILRILHEIDLDVQFLTDLLHKFMELRRALNRLLLINCAILCQTG
jgi:hypothetical protein